MNGEAIDVSGDDENGWRTLLSEPGQRSFDLSFDGVTKDTTLRELIITGASLLLTDVTVTFPEGDVFASDFYFSNLENTGSYNEAVKFSGSMQSSGEPTYTPAV
jgi:predicted secreted protein